MGRNFKYLSLDLESSPAKYHVCRFSVKTDNSETFGLHLGKLPKLMQHLGSNNIKDVAESWVEIKISWVEEDGAGWRWMHSLAIYILNLPLHSLFFSYSLYFHYFSSLIFFTLFTFSAFVFEFLNMMNYI